jgi:uncharacterized RDD family membrane protein YckC
MESNPFGFLAGLGLFGIVLAILASVFWLWMIIDCATSRREGTEKIVWLLVIIFLHFIGAFVYYFAGRNGGKSMQA